MKGLFNNQFLNYVTKLTLNPYKVNPAWVSVEVNLIDCCILSGRDHFAMHILALDSGIETAVSNPPKPFRFIVTRPLVGFGIRERLKASAPASGTPTPGTKKMITSSATKIVQFYSRVLLQNSIGNVSGEGCDIEITPLGKG